MDIFHGLDDDTRFEGRAVGDEDSAHRRETGIVAMLATEEMGEGFVVETAAHHMPPFRGHDPDGRHAGGFDPAR